MISQIRKNCATLKLWLEYLLFEIDSEVRVTDSEVRVTAAVCYTLQKNHKGEICLRLTADTF